ncbi:MAG: tRNA pseudouridine(54/55) synthase Pus10 [Salinirussus sp.]
MDVVSVAREALAAGPICDPCLGRLVADRSFGLTNRERGRSLRVAVSLADDEAFEEPGEECWVCEDECAAFDAWAEEAATALRGYDFDTYQVGTRVPPLFEENERLLREEAGLDADAGEALKSEFNREVGKRLGAAAGADVDFERPDVLALCDLSTGDVEVQINAAFVYGRYRKLERGIPQTEWPCQECNGTGRQRDAVCPGCDGTGYRYDESVEGYVAPPIREAMEGSDATFHGAGREDVDARMLGSGRPFVVEVTEPRVRDVDTEDLAAAIADRADGSVAVEGLRLATYETVERVKELPASKTYRADVVFEAPVDPATLDEALAALDGATVEQETPRRVDHRRASKLRTREVYGASGSLDDDRHATVEIHGEGGLYVKELVGGDDGRTEPSLSGLIGVGARVTALDVTGVAGENEPFERETFFRDDGN